MGKRVNIKVSRKILTPPSQRTSNLHPHCITVYALSWVIHRIQSEIYFGNPDWYTKWLGMVDRWCPAYHSEAPPLLWHVIGCGNGDQMI